MLESARSKKIQTFIKSHPEQLVKDQTMFISYGGQVHSHQLYWIPIEEYLIHNIRNGRFRSELLEKEEQLKRKLDPVKKEDAEIIRNLLLEQNQGETDALMADIQKNGQLEPGIITFDGAVMNANRRMAVMHVLYKKTAEDKYKYLKVGILPAGVDEVDLWKIEAGLQFGRDFRLQYGGVNELLKLREGEKQGLSPKDISVALIGRFNEKQVLEKLETLKLIDSYLSFINKKGEYHLITEEGDLEKFVSLQRSVITPLKNKNPKNKLELAELTAVAFTLISKTDVTHWNIRELKNIYSNSKAKKELLSPFSGSIPSAIAGVKTTKDKIYEGFTSAKEAVDNEKEKDKPERLLKKAKAALDGINVKSQKLKEPEFLQLLEEIKKRINALVNAAKK